MDVMANQKIIVLIFSFLENPKIKSSIDSFKGFFDRTKVNRKYLIQV